MKAFIFEHPLNKLTEKYFKHLKQTLLRMKAAFAARINLVTKVAEVANFSYWSKKLRTGTEAHEKIVILQCFERCQSAFK